MLFFLVVLLEYINFINRHSIKYDEMFADPNMSEKPTVSMGYSYIFQMKVYLC